MNNTSQQNGDISVETGVVPVEINAQVYVLQLQTKKSFRNALVTSSRLSEEAQNIWNTILVTWNTDVHLEKLLTLSNL
jgi:hypothetical protein